VSPRRILAVLEWRASDAAVVERAVEIASESGGYLTLVMIAPTPLRTPAGPYCIPRMSAEELRAEAGAALARAAALVPPDIPLLTVLDQGRTADVIARRVAVAAHDLVVVRRRRVPFRAPASAGSAPVTVVAG
jgi:nucleotide-binding universal stress UspA family protein